MKRKGKRKIKKKALKRKRKTGTNSKRDGYDKSIDLQKIVSFKFQALNKAYENFWQKREKEKEKQEELK